jgi:phospholipid/cholesterol/gamma-HCH transport system substrate-binding protein
MPRTRSLAWAQLKVGIVSVIALVLAAGLVFLLGGEGGFSWQQYPLKATFDNIAGLGNGSPVRVAGVEVGSVTEIEFRGDRVEVSFEIADEMRPRITTGSTAALGSVSLLGESAVDITPSSQGTPIPDWGYVKSGKPLGSITEVATQATAGIEQLTTILQDIRAGRGTVGQLFTNDSVYRELNGLLAAAEDVAGNIQNGRGTIGRLMNDPAAARALEGSMQNLEAVTAKIRAGEGSLGRLLNDDAMAKSLTQVTGNLETMTGRINSGQGTMGKLVNDQELYNRLNSMTNRLDKLVAALNQGEGTAGQLLKDRQMYDNMNGAIVQLRTLIAEITKDPKKYLNVRVSLF